MMRRAHAEAQAVAARLARARAVDAEERLEDAGRGRLRGSPGRRRGCGRRRASSCGVTDDLHGPAVGQRVLDGVVRAGCAARVRIRRRRRSSEQRLAGAVTAHARAGVSWNDARDLADAARAGRAARGARRARRAAARAPGCPSIIASISATSASMRVPLRRRRAARASATFMRVRGERSSWLTSSRSWSRSVIISLTRRAIWLKASVSAPSSSRDWRGTTTSRSPALRRATPS